MKKRICAFWLAAAMALGLFGCGETAQGPGPVSYTHLDVYKRQFQHFARQGDDLLGRGRGGKEIVLPEFGVDDLAGLAAAVLDLSLIHI